MQINIEKYEIEPDEEQKFLIDREIKYSRFVYNHLLILRHKIWEEQRKNLSFDEEKIILKKLKKKNGWLRNIENATLEQAIRDLDSDFFKFFKINGKYPKCRKVDDKEQWYKTKNINNFIRVHKQNFITLPKLDLVKVKSDKKITGRVTYAKINKSGDKYEVSLTIERQ